MASSSPSGSAPYAISPPLQDLLGFKHAVGGTYMGTAHAGSLQSHSRVVEQGSRAPHSSTPTLGSFNTDEFIIVSAAVNRPLYEYCKHVLYPQPPANFEHENPTDPSSTAGDVDGSYITPDNDGQKNDNLFDELIDYAQGSNPQNFDAQITSTPPAAVQLGAQDFALDFDIPPSLSSNTNTHFQGHATSVTSLPETSASIPLRRPNPCTICGKSYGRASDLRRHQRKHNSNAPRYACPALDCGYSNERADKLRDHQERRGH